MDTNKRTIYCLRHGELTEPIKYISFDIGRKRIVDVPITYCKSCKAYYTSYSNLFTLLDPTRLIYNGHPIVLGKGQVEKDRTKKPARFPRIVAITEDKKRRELERLEEEKERAKRELERKQKELRQKERNRKYIEGLRKVPYDGLIITNKPCFVLKQECPRCKRKTRTENVRIEGLKGYLLAKIRNCDHCNTDFVTPDQFHAIDKKATLKDPMGFCLHIIPNNVECEYVDGKRLFILREAYDEKYSRRRMPPHSDEYYDMSEEEYFLVERYYNPVFPVQLRKKSFLGEAGYSTSESESRRRTILAKCVDEYGKSKVIAQLKTNINLRMKQEDGSTRYVNALNVWRADIWFVENELDSE